MRSSFIATTGLKLVRTPSARDHAARRWMAVLATVGVLALAGGALGLITAPPGDPDGRTSPFSYFPSQ